VIFNARDYARLHALVFRSDYPGYKPGIVEAPHGDGRLDVHKRYAHVATKYLPGWEGDLTESALELWDYLHAAFDHAHAVARRLGVPEAFLPSLEACALRVLEYPAGVGGEQHTDFDLFTTLCYRDDPAGLVREGPAVDHVRQLDAVDPGLHLGEIGELVGLGPATLHHVRPLAAAQRSIVFFALPPHDVVLPSGQTVGAWVAERIARSRVLVPPPPADDADAWYAAEVARLRDRSPA
jgi:hypothetical protein